MSNEYRPKFPRTPFPRQRNYRLPFKTPSVEKMAVRIDKIWAINTIKDGERGNILNAAIELDKVERHNLRNAASSPFRDIRIYFNHYDSPEVIKAKTGKINAIAKASFDKVETFIKLLERKYCLGGKNAPAN
ncbi:MAG: hypothetical protein ABL867_09600 [Rickettsiales bacterium]